MRTVLFKALNSMQAEIGDIFIASNFPIDFSKKEERSQLNREQSSIGQ